MTGKKEIRLIAYTNIDAEPYDVKGLHTKNVKSLIKVMMSCIQRRERKKEAKKLLNACSGTADLL